MAPSSLNDIMNLIIGSQNHQQLARELKQFAKSDVGETILSSLGAEGQDPLLVLHPQTHTLGMLYILSARLHSHLGTQTVSLELVNTFCSIFDVHQARLAQDRVTLLARGIEHLAELNQNVRLAIGPLKNLLHHYPSVNGTLTTIHVVYLRTCVKAHCWNQGLYVLDVPIVELSKSISDVDYLDNLAYHYIGGVIYAVLKRWKDAEEFFETVITAPSNAISAIQVEAHKKMTLIQLIQYGKTRPLPKYAGQYLSQQLKQSSYQNFVKNYPASASTLNAILDKEQSTFAADGNVGLIKQAIKHSPRWIIRKLTDTYLTLSLEDISKATGDDVKQSLSVEAIEQATLLVLGMIERNEIHATLTPNLENPGSSIVTFRDPPPPTYFDPLVMEKILQTAQMQATDLVRQDREISKNKTYLSKTVKDKESSMHYDDMAEIADYGRMGGAGYDYE